MSQSQTSQDHLTHKNFVGLLEKQNVLELLLFDIEFLFLHTFSNKIIPHFVNTFMQCRIKHKYANLFSCFQK